MELKEILEDFYNNRNSYKYPLYQSSKFIGANFESIVRFIDTNLINQSLRDEFLLLLFLFQGLPYSPHNFH